MELLLTAFLNIFFERTFHSAYAYNGIKDYSVVEEHILFTGDVLLARDIERKMEREGSRYPFHRIQDVLLQYQEVIVNFESAIPEKHIPTPNFTTTFSTSKEHVLNLKEYGVTGATLANNHAYDYGSQGYENTYEVLMSLDIDVAGHPQKVSEEKVLYKNIDGSIFAIIPLHIIGTDDLTETQSVLNRVNEKSDFQIVSIHWGDEYKEKPNHIQRNVAHRLIDSGVDMIIGHHPHVVQSVEVYRHAPIFYSLGNFIFDQYEHKDTQEGLMVAVGAERDMLTYDLIPVTSADLHGAPRVMSGEEQRVFFAYLEDISGGFAFESLYSDSLVYQQ